MFAVHAAPIYPKPTLSATRARWHVLTHAAQKVWGCEGDEGEAFEQPPVHAMCRDANGQWEERKVVHHQDEDVEAYHYLTRGTLTHCGQGDGDLGLKSVEDGNDN